jgi:hypothetical protein
VGWFPWLALVVAVVVVLATLVRTLRQALQAWRSFKRLRRALGRTLYALEIAAARVGDNAAKARPSPALDRSLTRLRESSARLNVLRRAIDDVTGGVGRITAVYPHK